MDSKNIYLKMESITVEPYSDWWKNWFLEILLKFNYLSIYECYKFTIKFSGQTDYFGHIKEINSLGMSQAASIVWCNKEIIRDEKVTLFIKFKLPIEEIICSFSKKDHNDLALIYFKDNEKETYDKFKIPLKKFTTSITFNRIMVALIFFIVSTVARLYIF